MWKREIKEMYARESEGWGVGVAPDGINRKMLVRPLAMKIEKKVMMRWR